MMIQLNNQYRLRTLDDHNIALEEIRVSKEGREWWKPLSYYGSLKDAFVSCLDSARLLGKIKDKQDHLNWMNSIKDISDGILGTWEGKE